MTELSKAGFRPSPVFEYMVYRVFRLRDGEAFVRSFRVYATGYEIAKRFAYTSPEHAEVGAMFSACKVTTWFCCVKLMAPTSLQGESSRLVEYMGETKLSAAQVAYMDSHRVMR